MSGTVSRVPFALVPLPSAVAVTCCSTSMRRTWGPPGVHINTARLCSAGSGATRSPASSLVCGPPTPSSSSAGAVVCSRGRPSSVRTLVPSRQRARPRARCASEWDHPISEAPESDPTKNEGLRSFWAVLFVRAMVEDPAGCDPPLTLGGGVAVAFRQHRALGTREHRELRGCLAHGPHARAPTHSRDLLPAPAKSSLPTGAG